MRLDNGLFCCRNKEELESQSGVILDLVKRAGKQLMEGAEEVRSQQGVWVEVQGTVRLGRSADNNPVQDQT